ncbi:phage DNA replication protein [Thermoclostridium stercorarium subsp. stercorarium DSM 8532]|nr:phage DNA replication protein [Thermoclostridium stercorarium subsp. stercorarium DSM 8532]
MDDPRYEPEPCPYCGRMLKHKAYSLFGRLFGSHLEQCDCPGAVAKRERLYQEQLKRQQEEELRQRMRKIERLFDQSRLGKRFRDRTFEAFEIRDYNRKAFEIALDYAQNFGRYKEKGEGLFITGGYGVGKTHLAAAITNYLIQNLKGTVIFGNVTTLLGRLRFAYSDDSEYEETQILKELYDVDLLVIDDLGKEKPTPWVEEKLYNVINERYENYKPIIVTSNLGVEEIEKRLETCGGAIVSRIIEMCRGVKIMGADYRKEKIK